MFNKIRLLLPLLPKLGLANVANVAGYRLALASGLIEKVMPAGNRYHDPLFHGSSHSTKDLSCPVSKSGVVALAEDQLKGNAPYFSDRKYNVGSPPDWFLNPVKQKRYPDTDSHWSRLPDFSDETGDIKIIWEASRFDWALVFARAYRLTRDERYFSALNKWASDWTEKNPLNRGPNWKCGQEAAIRMMNLMPAAFVLGQVKPSKRFVFEVRDLWPELPKAMGVVKNPFVLIGMAILEQVSYAAMHGGVALSPGIRNGMLKGLGNHKKLAMIPNGCDVEIFKPGKNTQKSDFTLLSGIPKNNLKCIFTGAHGVANGLDAVLDAAAVLKEKGRTDISLVFVGDGKLKPDLKKRALDEDLDNCAFLDPIPKVRLAELLQQVDVGMMILDNVPAFYYGTSPNKFFDYIACGLPVLNNYPGWLKEIIIQNQCGVAVPPENPEAFADALIHLADNPGERELMGNNGRKFALTEFNRFVLADKLVSFLEDILRK